MYLRNNYGLKHHSPRLMMFSVPNESSNLQEQLKKRSTGMLPGVSDTILVVPGRVIFVEFKDHKGKQSPAQVEFQQGVTELGHEYWLIRSLDEFIDRLSSVITIHHNSVNTNNQ